MKKPTYRPRTPRRVWLGVIAVAALLALPVACDDNGTGPGPNTDELPDTIPSGTYEVEDLHVPAGTISTIDGDVVIHSSGMVRVDGTVLMRDGASLVVVAQDSLLISGFVAPDTLEDGPSAARTSGGTRTMPVIVADTRVSIAAPTVRLVDGYLSATEVHIATVGAGTIEIRRLIRGKPGASSQDQRTPGESGADIHIGDEQAIQAFDDAEGLARPALIHILPDATILAGAGGSGWDDVFGTKTLEDHVVEAGGTQGGRGGSIYLAAAEVVIEGTVRAGPGGEGGWCGESGDLFLADGGSIHLDSQSLDADPGTAEGEPGFSIECATGDGGPGGDVIIDAPTVEGDLLPHGGPGGYAGGAHLRAGDGGPNGGRGGSIDVLFGIRGPTGTPDRDPVDPGLVIQVQPGGNGGHSQDRSIPGGDGGSISLQTRLGEPVNPLLSRIFLPAFNGGNGYTGCAGQTYGPGSPGGAGGDIVLVGGPLPELIAEGEEQGFLDGGAGSDGLAPGAFGIGGSDDDGHKLGDDGAPGEPCNPRSSVTSVDPAEAVLSDADLLLVLGGSNLYVGDCVIWVGVVQVDGDCTSPTAGTALVEAGQVPAGAYEVCSDAPAPGGGRDACAPFLLWNPNPILEAIHPETAGVGSGPVLLTATGTLGDEVQIRVDGVPQPTDRISATEATAELPTDITSAPGPHEIDLVAAGAEEPSTSRTFTTVYEAPGITELSPGSTLVGTGGFTLTIRGSVFYDTSTVTFNGTPLEAAFTDGGAGTDDQLSVTIPGNLIGPAGAYPVIVENPTPGGGTAEDALQVLNRVPVLTDIEPDTVWEDSGPLTLTVTGEFFIDSSRVWLEGGPRPTTPVSSTELEAAISADITAIPDEYAIWVSTPAPGGGVSDRILQFTVLPLPTITGFDPEEDVAGGPGGTYRVFGADFPEQGSVVEFDGVPKTTNWISSGELEFVLEPSDLVGGYHEVAVVVGDGAASSAIAQYTINNPAPVAGGTMPFLWVAGAGPFSLRLDGSGLNGVDAVAWNDTPLAIASRTATEIVLTVPEEQANEVGTVEIVGTASEPGGGNGVWTLEVIDAQPVIESIDPPAVQAGSGASPVTIVGQNFRAGVYATLQPPGSDDVLTILPDSWSATEVSLTIAAPALTTAGEGELTVWNVPVVVDDQGTTWGPWSDERPFTVSPAVDDPCATATPIVYGETFAGTVDDEDCVIPDGSFTYYLELLEITTTDVASAFTFEADPGLYLTLYKNDVRVGSLFANSAETPLLLTPLGDYVVELSSVSSFDPPIVYGLRVGPAESEEIEGCPGGSAFTIVQPGLTTTQTLDETSCVGSSGPPDFILRRGDDFTLAIGAGETVTITVASDDFDTALRFRIPGGTDEEFVIDENAGVGTSETLTYTNTSPFQRDAQVEAGTSGVASELPPVGVYTATFSSP